jgi:hypothetical protein
MDSLQERARRLLAGRPGAVNLSQAAPAPGPQLIRFAMNCSVTVRPFLVVAEAHGDRLRMRRNELLQAGGRNSGGPVAAVPSLGSFSFDAADWPGCPHCGARDNPAYDLNTFWMCARCGGFNCAGNDRRGVFRCACGHAHAGGFYRQEFFDVRGARTAAAASPLARPASSASGSLPAAPDAPLLRLPRKG